MQPQHLRIETGRAGLHVVDWQAGPDDRTTLLCIHGITANARAFDGIAQALLPDVRSLAVDLVGRGESDKPDDGYGIARHVDDMLAVLDGLRLDAVAVAGWSLGAAVAMQLAAGHSTRVDRLILLDPRLGAINDLALRSLGRGWKRLERTYPDRETAIAEWRKSPTLPRVWDEDVEAFVLADLRDLPDGTVGHQIDPSLVAKELEAPASPLASVIPVITCPTLILRATDALYDEGDQLLSAEDAERARTRFADARVIDIPGTNHYTITLGRPEATIAAIRAFLA